MHHVKEFFSDKKGKVVIAQWPNAPLWFAIFFWGIQFIENSTIQTLGFWGVIISLTYWAYLEIFYGVNRFRRFLGIAVLISQIIKISMLF